MAQLELLASRLLPRQVARLGVGRGLSVAGVRGGHQQVIDFRGG